MAKQKFRPARPGGF